MRLAVHFHVGMNQEIHGTVSRSWDEFQVSPFCQLQAIRREIAEIVWLLFEVLVRLRNIDRYPPSFVEEFGPAMVTR